MQETNSNIETHPWEPFAPSGSKVLILGTFPPGRNRWCMDFFYPNRTNDFWPMMGLLFFNDRKALVDDEHKTYRLDAIKSLLTDRGIALYDSCRRIIRLQGNASDKFLQVVEPVDVAAMLDRMPQCRDIATTGEKAAETLASQLQCKAPSMGRFVELPDWHRLWRMPSTSRAYPLALEKKAHYYRQLFENTGIL